MLENRWFCAINAAQVEVKFGVAVDKANLLEDGKGGAIRTTGTNKPVVTFNTIYNVAAGSLTGELSKDGKH